MTRLNKVYETLLHLEQGKNQGVNANDISKQLGIDRSTASRYLNELVKENKAIKISGKPVQYKSIDAKEETNILTVGESIRPILEKGIAAFLYPTTRLPILITGETGTGKTHLAELLSQFAKKHANKKKVPFIVFNCADYAQNAELLVGQIFGIKEGAFTGATKDKIGLVEQANNGILFLDEIHRLPPSGQEMLFYLMDKGVYRRLGETTKTHTANVTLIGATTEKPSKVLLPTLLRRFSVKLNLPPLRERTIEERNELINEFLSEEAKKMNATLSITDEAREFLHTYSCPGNIGQLKSDIQIASACAYLRFLNKQEDHVIIKLEDVKGNVVNPASDQQRNGVYPLNKAAVQNEKKNITDIPNIYEQLNHMNEVDTNKIDDSEITEIINDYIHTLSNRYRHKATSNLNWRKLLDEDLLHALNDIPNQLADILPIPIDLKQLYVIGLHLQNYRTHNREETQKGALPVIIHPNVSYREAAGQIAKYLEERINLSLPTGEVELIAHFLTNDNHERVSVLEQSIAVLLVTHGLSTASSMADVTNTLLGNNVIHAIDMPLDVSVETTYQRVREKVLGLPNINGVLLLVDIGSLITIGDKIQHELDIPIKTLSSVNLPMVLEAGRKSLADDMTLDEIYERTRKAMTMLIDENEQTYPSHKKRMIATVCFTGEGAAQLLESWINKQLSSLDSDVLVRTVRIDPITKDTSVINDLKNYYDVIAIIGTVPVSIDGIPYIPAWELLQDEGVNRLFKLLEVTRKKVDVTKKTDISKEEIPHLIRHGLEEITKYVNPKTITTILEKELVPISHYYQWDTTRELGMWMHIGSLIDRIISANINQNQKKLIESIPIDRNIVISLEEQTLWNPLFYKLEDTFDIELLDIIKKELIKLSR